MKKQITLVETFFSPRDAFAWVTDMLDIYLDDDTEIEEVEIVNLGGGYRAGVSFVGKQLELFGAEEDA